MTRRAYTYVLLRYRHDALAGEFANVGVVLHEPMSGFLGAQVRHTLGRLAKMFPDLDAEPLKAALRSLERAVNDLARSEGGDLLATLTDAGALARSVMPTDDTSFVWGPIGSGVTEDPAETLQRLYRRFVGRYDERQTHHRDDAAVWKPVRDRLAERNLADRLQPKTITSLVDRVEFEHAWENGAWHCYQPLSFDLANEENIRDKARRWAGHMLALGGASDPFRPYFFVGSPSDLALVPAYRAAIGILKLSPCEPRVIEEAGIDDLVSQIEDEIRAHDAGVRSGALER
jgi:hypothetical protein